MKCLFFVVKDTTNSLIAMKDAYSYIYNFSINGKFVSKGKSAELFIPNNYTDTVYYITDNTRDKKHPSPAFH